ncbi:hypothetical protein [Burkholderia cenocepacia]|nr:hypothetical protein [Burkholderia cenocepacia]
MPDFLGVASFLIAFAVCALVGSRLTEKREAKMTEEERATMQTW